MIIVQKFGGTSLATPKHIKRAAALIKKELDSGNKVVAVVSAMGKFTDVLVEHIQHFDDKSIESMRVEQDVVLSAGEQISAGLLSLALLSLGVQSRSWLGWQIPICTSDQYTKASIINIYKENILASLLNEKVPVIAGFQGINEESKRIATIGRGGSDISAVEIAAIVNAHRCDIYTDVDGVYTADPNLVMSASKLAVITYDEMLEMSSMGAQVLHSYAVESAMYHKIKLQVLSSFNNNPGTLLIERGEDMSKSNKVVTAITCNNDEACVSIHKVKSPVDILLPLSQASINVNIIVQNFDSRDFTCTISKLDVVQALNLLNHLHISVEKNISIISVIGIGMISNSGIACKMFQVLQENNIEILAITTSEIKISVLLHEEYRELAVRLLHTTYNLDAI